MSNIYLLTAYHMPDIVLHALHVLFYLSSNHEHDYFISYLLSYY